MKLRIDRAAELVIMRKGDSVEVPSKEKSINAVLPPSLQAAGSGMP